MTETRHLSEAEAQMLVDGLLPEGDEHRVAAHHAACPECQALVLSFHALDEALAGLSVPEPPADFTAGVFARIDARERSAAAERRLALAILGVVATALAVVVAVAGRTALGPLLTEASRGLARVLQAARISGQVLQPVVSALRTEILVATAAVGLPLFLALRRLVPTRQRLAA